MKTKTRKMLELSLGSIWELPTLGKIWFFLKVKLKFFRRVFKVHRATRVRLFYAGAKNVFLSFPKSY